MGNFNLTVYHGGRFGYDKGILQYIRGQKTLIEDVENDYWSYKDPTAEWLEEDLKLFAIDRDTLEMCRIAELRSHVEMYVVHEVDEGECFSKVGYVDVGGRIGKNPRNQLVVYEGQQGKQVQYNNVQQASEGDNVNPNVAAKNARNESNSNNDSNDEEFVPSYLEVDRVDDVHFTDNEEEYDDDSGFEGLTDVKDDSGVDKGKMVVNADFSDDESFNSDELDLEYEVGDGEEEDEYERRRYPIHKDIKDMSSYKWEVKNVFVLKEEFKDTVTVYAIQTRRGIRYAKFDLDCPFWLYAAKIGDETTWQLRSINFKHTCGQARRVGIIHTLWLSKTFKKKVEHNPKVKINELVNKA
ncbi:hypothetical protein Ahy_B06g080593 [Arachis hypogaea]|uniref:PB1-like domain-containing protein n=1 Tax=Arachis hypogaea TaxID=3818 RepID=A0A444YIE7_ARAHY|nr:hypothetical protein Ahy_B06g080593 [Arachis hypogaea]